jgi:hypothetical protein
VLVEPQDERRQVRLPETVGLWEIQLQIVALEEPVLGGEEDHGARVLMHLTLDRLPDTPGQLLGYPLHLPQGILEAHLVGLPLVLRDPSVHAQVYREHRLRMSLQALLEPSDVFGLRCHISPLCDPDGLSIVVAK